MLVGCPHCAGKFRVNETLMREPVMTVRCSSCHALFRVARPADQGCHTLFAHQTAPSTPARILVAHESPSFCETVSGILAAGAYDVSVCHDGRSVLEVARGGGVDAALLDVALPGMYGFEVCEELRADTATAGIKVILFASVYDRTRYKRLPDSLYGADDYIEKHHIPDQLVGKIGRLLARGRIGTATEEPVADDVPSASTPAPTREPSAETEATRTILRLDEEAETTVSPPTPENLSESHVKARRLARIIASDIALYNQTAVEEGVRTGSFFTLLARDIAEGRELYRKRVAEEIRVSTAYLEDAFAQIIDRVSKELGL